MLLEILASVGEIFCYNIPLTHTISHKHLCHQLQEQCNKQHGMYRSIVFLMLSSEVAIEIAELQVRYNSNKFSKKWFTFLKSS